MSGLPGILVPCAFVAATGRSAYLWLELAGTRTMAALVRFIAWLAVTYVLLSGSLLLAGCWQAGVLAGFTGAGFAGVWVQERYREKRGRR